MTVHGKLVECPPYGIYKHSLETSVDIGGITDDKARSALQSTLSVFASALSDWTHKGLNETSDIFYALHAVGLKLTKISGHVHSDGNSVFLDSSSRDLHLSTQVSDPI